MYQHGDLLGQALLQHAATGILLVLLNELVDGLLVERSEYLDVAFGILVAHVEPELVEAVGRGALGVEPDVAALGLAELLAVALGDERTGKGEGLDVVAQCAADKLGASGHVAPLVVAAQLQLHALMLVEVQEVVALEQLIGELGERQSVAGGAVESLLHGVLGHHVVHGDVLAHLTGEVEEGEVLHPVVVVHQLGTVIGPPYGPRGGFYRFIGRDYRVPLGGRKGSLPEVEELGHLGLDALLVVAQRLVVEQIALLALTAGVANHACGSTHEDDGLVAATLQVAQHHDATEVAYVE